MRRVVEHGVRCRSGARGAPPNRCGPAASSGPARLCRTADLPRRTTARALRTDGRRLPDAERFRLERVRLRPLESLTGREPQQDGISSDSVEERARVRRQVVHAERGTGGHRVQPLSDDDDEALLLVASEAVLPPRGALDCPPAGPAAHAAGGSRRRRTRRAMPRLRSAASPGPSRWGGPSRPPRALREPRVPRGRVQEPGGEHEHAAATQPERRGNSIRRPEEPDLTLRIDDAPVDSRRVLPSLAGELPHATNRHARAGDGNGESRRSTGGSRGQSSVHGRPIREGE